MSGSPFIECRKIVVRGYYEAEKAISTSCWDGLNRLDFDVNFNHTKNMDGFEGSSRLEKTLQQPVA